MFRRFMIVCWVLFAIATVVSLLGYAGYEFYEKKTIDLIEMGFNPVGTYDENRYIDLIPENKLVLIAQNKEKEDRSGRRDDDPTLEDEHPVVQNDPPYSDIPDGFKVVEPDSTDWRNAPIVIEDEARDSRMRLSAMRFAGC